MPLTVLSGQVVHPVTRQTASFVPYVRGRPDAPRLFHESTESEGAVIIIESWGGVGPRPTACAGQVTEVTRRVSACSVMAAEGHAAGALFGARAPGPLRLASWGSKRRPISQITTRPPAG